MDLPLVQKLKARELLGDDVDTRRAAAVSVQIGSSERDRDELASRLLELADAVLEAAGDGSLTFYEIWSVGLALVHLLKRAKPKGEARAGEPPAPDEEPPEPTKKTRKKK